MVVSEARIDCWNPAVLLRLPPVARLDDAQLFDFCQLNRDLRIERDTDGALRSPDAAWLRHEHWEVLRADQREKCVPLCAEFVVELRSPSDRLQALQRRMRKFMRSGAMLGWRIDPGRGSVHVYRPGEAIQTLLHPDADAFD